MVVKHFQSRTGDPFEHYHILVFNIGQRLDQTFGSIESHPLYENQKWLHARFQSQLANRLSSKCGFQIEERNGLAAIKGFPEELVRQFSTRSQQIENRMQQTGFKGPVAKMIHVHRTRGKKLRVPLSKRLKEWVCKIDAYGRHKIRVMVEAIRDTFSVKGHQQRQARGIVRKAIRYAAINHGAFSMRQLESAALTIAIGRRIPRARIQRAVKQELNNEKRVVKVGIRKAELLFTSVEELGRNQTLMASFQSLEQSVKHAIPVKRLGRHFTNANLDIAKRVIGATRKSGLTFIRGKEAILVTAITAEAYQKRGYEVVGIASKPYYAAMLSRATEVRTYTPREFAKMLRNRSHREVFQEIRKKDLGLPASPKRIAKEAERHHKPRLRIGKKTLLIVHHGDRIAPGKELQDIIERVKRKGGKIAFVLDDKHTPQPQSVLDICRRRHEPPKQDFGPKQQQRRSP